MKKIGIIFFLFFHLFYSCEYDKDFIYTNEITPPEDDFKVEINLSDVKPNSTLFIYQYTKVSFAIDTKGHEVLNQTITIDADAYIDNNSIYLYPLNDNSVRKLVFDIELKTNTGSIAEKLGYEKYVGRYEYDVKFVKLEEDFTIDFQGGVSDEGYLQLQWNEPEFDNATFQKYELTFFNSITDKQETYIITDPKQTGFIDKNYVWGYRAYQLTVHYKNNDVNYTSARESYFTPAYYGSGGATKFSYQYIDHEWMNVSWEYTGYKCKYLLEVDGDGTKIECDENKRNAKIQRFRFPIDPQRFKLYVIPYHLPYEEYKKCPFIAADYKSEDECYVVIKPPMAWNLERDEYYFMEDGLLNIYSVSNFKKKRDLLLRPVYTLDPSDRIILSATPLTSQIAIYKHTYGAPRPFYEIYIYNVNNFEDPLPVKILNPWEVNIFIADNSRLFFRDGVIDDNGYYLYSSLFVADSKTGEIVAEKKMVEGYAKIVGSYDGKYICEYYEDGYRIYKFENDVFIPLYSYHNTEYSYEICQFSYTNPNELILSGGNETIVFDVSILRKKYKVGGLFIVQDPITGNYACLDEFYNENSLLAIYDNTFDRILTRIPFSQYKYPHYFMKNRLIIYGAGYSAALDLTDYIK